MLKNKDKVRQFQWKVYCICYALMWLMFVVMLIGVEEMGVGLVLFPLVLLIRTIAFNNDPHDERRDTAIAERSREPEEAT